MPNMALKDLDSADFRPGASPGAAPAGRGGRLYIVDSADVVGWL